MQYQGLKFQNKADKTIEIDVEGYIGWDPWDSPENQANTKEKMKAELKKLAQLDAETIVVNINSYGGDVNHGISIHDLLAEHKAHIITKVNGMTASAATIIAIAGDERKMSDNALFLVHNASTIGWGDKNDLKTAQEDLKKIDDRIANIYAKATGKDKQEMLDLMNEEKGRGKWLTANEALQKGFITEIYEPLQAAAYFSNDILKRYGLPPSPENKPDDLSGGIAKKIIIELKNILQPKNNTMNKTDFQRLAKVAGVEGFVVEDNGFFLNADQAKAIENALAKIEDERKAYEGLGEKETVAGLKTQIETLTKSGSEASAKIERLEKEIEDLSKTPPAKPTGASADGDGDEGNAPVDEEAMHFFNLSQVK